ncbi:MAG: RagB/SusD family nutrient uptake outer membrane protein, partial [Proteiniphilum sp.]|nr:RagB/SusD family nutrient uptake outer membrane protein [Proteiniphilum sp.]
MKRYKLHKGLAAVLLASLFITVSCSDDLEKSPTNQYDSATFWTNETNALIGLTAVYRGNLSYAFQVEPTDWWSYASFAFLELATDNGYDRRGDNSNLNRLTNGTLLPNNAVLLSLWKGSYKKITIANDFLAHIDAVPMDETKKLRFRSEARFIRACQYFYLAQHFGDVPLVIKVLTSEEANTVLKTPKAEIENFVAQELNEVAAGLPRFKDIAAAETGRA